MSERYGVLIAGINGATASTAVVGALSASSKEDASLGSLVTSVPTIDNTLPALQLFRFGGWDTSRQTVYEAALGHRVLPPEVLVEARGKAERIRPWPAVVTKFDTDEAQSSSYGFFPPSFAAAVEKIREDIAAFKILNDIDKVIVVYLGPPLKHDPGIFEFATGDTLSSTTSQLLASADVVYAVGAILSGCAFLDFTPNVALEIPAVQELATSLQVPIAGRDGSTGQTLLKTVLAELFRRRNLRVDGWYSTNILGNNDGLVLSRSEHRVLKMQDKSSVLAPILGYEPQAHVIDISYYLPRGDNKEAWDSIDFSGWFGMPMQLKINLQGRDSISAAPLVLDLCRHLAYALECKAIGLQKHLAVYFKRPIGYEPLSFNHAYGLMLDYYS